MKQLLKTHPGLFLWAIILCGILLRLAFVVPGFNSQSTERYLRPDSEFYMRAAHALAAGESYPGSVRAPGFSATAAILLKTAGTPLAIPLFFAVTGGLATYFVYRAGKEYASNTAGLLAAGLYAFNITAIVNAPMLLTDTFFGILTSLQLWLFILFWKRRRFRFLLLAFAVAALGTLIRPINLLWFLPGLFLLGCFPCSLCKKLGYGFLALAIFWGIISPWMARNAMQDAGFCIDINTGAMLHQNGAMLLAEVKNSDFELEKAKMLKELDTLFQDKQRFPTVKSQVDHRKKEYQKLIMKHPFIWLKQQFQWKILLPDIPTGFEILGVTSAGRGTMGILAKQGLWAAVDHYFNGKVWLPFTFLPFLLIVFLTYLGCGIQLGADLCRLKAGWIEIFFFLAFVEYYLFLPGAITAPRYQIPALPFAVVLAAMGLLKGYRFWQEKYLKSPQTGDIL